MEKGMKWYDALKVLLPLWSVWEVLNYFVSFSNEATRIGMTFFEFMSFDIAISIFTLVAAVGDAALMMIMWSFLKKHDSFVVKYPLYLIAFTCGYCGILSVYMLLAYSNLESAASCLGMILNRVVIFAPTYFYLKHRFPSEQTESLCPPAPTLCENCGAVIPYPECADYRICQKCRGVAIERQVAPSFAALCTKISQSLSGVAVQTARDRIVADLLQGRIDPYTGQPITCEVEWNAYTAAYYADKDAAQADRSQQPPPVAQNDDTPQAAAPITPPPPAPAVKTDTTFHPLYCRLCGAKLHADSLFCERCGEPVKREELSK